MKSNGWTPERRRRQAELIQNWRPWEHSTGPQSEEGKEISKDNARKHGGYSAEIKALRSLLREQDDYLRDI